MKIYEDLISEQFASSNELDLFSDMYASGSDLEKLSTILQSKSSFKSSIDVGCGEGYISYLLSQYSQKVIAFDIKPEMLDIVEKETQFRALDNIEVSQGNIHFIPFQNRSFDFSVSRYSAHHWDNIITGLSEVHRILKEDGEAVFIDIIAPVEQKMDTWLQTVDFLRDSSHVRNYSISEWNNFLKKVRFDLIDFENFKMRLDFSQWIERKKTSKSQKDMIRILQKNATSDIKKYYDINEQGDFSVDVAYFHVKKKAFE